ncbi:hypothetical protein MCP_0092 [Methanocella paludicola SANAE]|uniref:Uncharacterized protein n=1 Tax=Methanocella paludicola (strain DSM 17711 / JCM 13418 / NBRC 101707 / SANAE) TaxID=304371 RepID=D1YUP2_METPS|nr:hypothetical protein [Methanocella paludicola]BAI60164.1 hypothetical protein MCP_0092 [Methanocella paludicola SANAE]
MNNKLVLIIGVVVIIGLIIGLCYYKFDNNFVTNNNSTINTITPIPTENPVENDTLTILPNDYVINNINWTQYPNLQQGYIYKVYIAGPTDTVPYKFMEVQILTEVKDTNDRELIRSQLSGVAYEVRKIYGPNSDIHILGTKNGAATWDISLYPNQNDAH